jgi:hypothetical protein
MNKLLTTTSDIFESCENRVYDPKNGSTVLIPHVCNNIGLFGAGFAGAIRDRYPIVSTNFELLGNKTKLGYVQYVSIKKAEQSGHEIIFANMIAQNGTISKKNTRQLKNKSFSISMWIYRTSTTQPETFFTLGLVASNGNQIWAGFDSEKYFFRIYN